MPEGVHFLHATGVASIWHRAMVYLGLQDDEEYGYDQYGYAAGEEGYPARPQGPGAEHRAPEFADVGGRGYPESRDVRPLRDVQPTPARDHPTVGQEHFGEPNVRALPRDELPPGVSVSRSGVARAVATTAGRVHVVEPQGFNDAPEIGDRVKENQAVILNLQGASRDLQRRLIDFSSGLAFAVGGAMSRVADSVFLITPNNVRISDEEKERLQARGLYRAD